jgi:hypothetical protein
MALTQKDKAAWLERDFGYEVGMMRLTTDRFAGATTDVQLNLLIESCGAHLRNILDFLFNKNHVNKRYYSYIASDFVPSTSIFTAKTKRDPNPTAQPKKLTDPYTTYELLHDQLFHMGATRTQHAIKQLNTGDLLSMRNDIEADLAIFAADTGPVYGTDWNIVIHEMPLKE